MLLLVIVFILLKLDTVGKKKKEDVLQSRMVNWCMNTGCLTVTSVTGTEFCSNTNSTNTSNSVTVTVLVLLLLLLVLLLLVFQILKSK